jgi:hypothetical protein
MADFRAAATFATPFGLSWWQRCKYSRLTCRPQRTATCAASTSKILINRLPCLLIDPSR